MPDDFDDLPEDEQQEIVAQLEEVVLSVDPAALRDEIARLNKLIDQARGLEKREIETKLDQAARACSNEQGIFADPKMKLLVFTEHKDTLDFLAGDGKDGRPLGKLREWGLTVTQIHGGMKIGDRDTPGTRIYAEREFRESAQVLVATEAAGEGINLQFCWLMINYDIPWNPVRLEQRVGPHPPLRPGARLPHLQLRRQEHPRGPRPAEAARAAQGDSQRAGHRPGLRRRRRGLPVEPAGKALPRPVRPEDQRARHHRPDRRGD